MQEGALRKVLLIQAIEETDRDGAVLPLTERTEATRAAGSGSVPTVAAGMPLPAEAESFLVRRAGSLLQFLRGRSPGLDHFLSVAGGATSFDRAALSGAFVLGVLLSALGGGLGNPRFTLPLVVLVIWNVLVYSLLLGRARKAPTARASVFGRFYASRVRRHVDDLLDHSTRFNAPLTPGLRRFAADWWDIGQPLFFARARRLLHLCAALVAIGLAAGCYFRAFVLRSEVGPQSVHFLLTLLFGPVSLLSGIPIPGGGTAATAANWAHLIAWAAGLYIVLPRIIAACVSSVNVWRVSRRLPVPPGVVGYLRTLIAR
ncbi:MAG TPA: hypothetical protein VHB68_10880 [Steroidobacteraceae bacterium]|nr:hypothetical protein [Steroidobacteraceae bacterium]